MVALFTLILTPLIDLKSLEARGGIDLQQFSRRQHQFKFLHRLTLMLRCRMNILLKKTNTGMPHDGSQCHHIHARFYEHSGRECMPEVVNHKAYIRILTARVVRRVQLPNVITGLPL